MNRGAGRRPVFTSRRDEVEFLHLVGEVSQTCGIEIHAYCLMHNHYHLLVHTPAGGLGQAMQRLAAPYVQRHNRRLNTDGPMFRGRYAALLISEDANLLAVSRYVHLNPVEAGVVARPEQYVPSSYRAYVGLEPAPEWLRLERTLGYFAPGDARAEYQRFVESKGAERDPDNARHRAEAGSDPDRG